MNFYLFVFLIAAVGCDNSVQNKPVDNKYDVSEPLEINVSWTMDTLEYLLKTPGMVSDSLSKAILYHTLGSHYQKNEKLQEAIEMYDRALLLVTGDSSLPVLAERAKILVKKGSIFSEYDDYETAYSLFLEAEELFLNSENYDRLINLYGRMGNIFLRNSNFEMNKQIIQKENNIIDKVTDLDAVVDYYIHQGSVCFHDDDYENSDILWKKALEILNQTQNQHQLHTVYYNLGLWARKQRFWNESESYNRKSLSAAEESGNKSNICDGLIGTGMLLYEQKKFNEAESLIQKALQIAQEIQSKLLLRNCYDLLSSLEYERNNLKKAFEYYELLNEYDLELISAETQNKMNFMSVKYDLARKESNIRDLENKTAIQHYQIKLRDTLLISSSMLMIILIILTVVYIGYMKRKRQFAETRIRQLEQEKQLIATQAVLDGEIQERTRLARDLHDGLGSILTGAKLKLQQIKKDATLDNNTLERYDAAVGMLDESIREMRRVAHHLMPEALNGAGLKQSIADFCNSIPNAAFNYYGDEIRLDSKREEMLYRITHELVNNALKHSGAAHILVQIVKEANAIALTVQDNGCGFDPQAMTRGMGLGNIRNRVAAFGGNLMVDTKPGVGTEVNVELKIPD